eukprot:CAMPEP_0114455830 /NCGR_PEP_ID=MMETSP0104-20121206/3309_1 /TAXON_ID=37642 ORGANISM="Paraphysomonas imperforata, Strain PA2" /NCGR_SAMPLE_ID=MMETSP0104 /ASSEMBLY_ACC=CAM_ASM_000202 /LENGTH=462 /DNA_ID=CAMNT_0001628277 /DNA_START=52 /DNA_END=1437 /DNA_ORIENTATION=-
MGADLSLPDDDKAELTSDAVVGLIGKSYYDEAKWVEVTGDADVITVAELKRQIELYHGDQNGTAEMKEDSNVLNQESTRELDDPRGDDTVSFDGDDDDSATKLNDESSLLLAESTRDVDDFTAPPSISVNRVVDKLPEEEFKEKHRRLKILYQEVRESRVNGVIAKRMKENMTEIRELLTIYYDQTGQFFIMKNKKEKMLYLIAEYYYLIDHHPKGRDFMRFYGIGSQLKISGLHKFSDIRDAKPIAIGILKTYRGLKISHNVLDIDIQTTTDPDNYWDLFVTATSLVTVNDDKPRKVVEFFYLKERVEDEFRAMYGEYYIKKQVMQDMGFRPLWLHSELIEIPDQDYRSYDEVLGKPTWLLEKEEKERLEEEERREAARAERKRLRKLKKAGLDDSESESSSEDEEDELDDDGNVIRKAKKKVKDPEFVELEPNDDEQSKSSLLSATIVKKVPRDESSLVD